MKERGIADECRPPRLLRVDSTSPCGTWVAFSLPLISPPDTDHMDLLGSRLGRSSRPLPPMRGTLEASQQRLGGAPVGLPVGRHMGQHVHLLPCASAQKHAGLCRRMRRLLELLFPHAYPRPTLAMGRYCERSSCSPTEGCGWTRPCAQRNLSQTNIYPVATSLLITSSAGEKHKNCTGIPRLLGRAFGGRGSREPRAHHGPEKGHHQRWHPSHRGSSTLACQSLGFYGCLPRGYNRHSLGYRGMGPGRPTRGGTSRWGNSGNSL